MLILSQKSTVNQSFITKFSYENEFHGQTAKEFVRILIYTIPFNEALKKIFFPF